MQDIADDWDDGEHITAEKLELYLTRFETYSDLVVSKDMPCVVEKPMINVMRNVLTAYAAANRYRFPLTAAIQLCAVLQVTTISEEATFYLLQTLSDIMKPYRRNEFCVVSWVAFFACFPCLPSLLALLASFHLGFLTAKRS